MKSSSTYVFGPKLINSKVNSAKRTSSDLLLDHILVDPVFSGPIILASSVFGAGIERFLPSKRSVH